jgi:SAM-dependent methyltransferase
LSAGVFDALDSGPKSLPELTAATGASARGLRAVANALVGINLLEKDRNGRYSLTPESAEFLVSGKPAFHGGIFHHMSRSIIPAWLRLNDSVRSGKPAFSAANQTEQSTYFEQFVTDLFPMNYPGARSLGEALDLKGASTEVRVLDVGAGAGVWGIALAQQSEFVQVTAVDLPGVLSITERMTQRFGVGPRFHFVPGDIHEVSFGSGYNAATVGHILHGDGEKRSRELLRKLYAALAPGGVIAIAEFLVNEERTGPLNGLVFAVNMLAVTENGDTFSFGEIASWLADAGFTDPRTLPIPGPSPLILATKPPA